MSQLILIIFSLLGLFSGTAYANDKWEKAKILGKVGKYAWTKWVFDWNATPGQYVLQCRAKDELGCEQPSKPPWNLGGFGNNSPQSIKVFVQK